MSRAYDYNDDWDDESILAWGRYMGALESTLCSERTYQILCELETALLAMPQQRLIDHYLAKDGDVCALGALYCFRAQNFGDQWSMAASRLEYLYGDAEDPEDAREVTRILSRELGLTQTMGREISDRNDENDCEPEWRWKAMLAHVRYFKAEHARLVEKRAGQRTMRKEKKHAAQSTARDLSVPGRLPLFPLAGE